MARMGGDEFVVIAPGMQPEGVGEKSSRLNQLAIQAGRHVCGKDVISLSVGTAFCPDDGFDVERLLAEADRKMYSMKQVHHALAEQAKVVREADSAVEHCPLTTRRSATIEPIWSGESHGTCSPSSASYCWGDCSRLRWCDFLPDSGPMNNNLIPA